MREQMRRFIEDELRRYKDTKDEYELICEQITHESPINDGQPRGTDISRPTERKALRLCSNPRLRYLETTIKAVESVMMRLPEEKFRLVQMRYWDRPRVLTDDGIAAELHIDRRTLYRWIDGVLLAIANELGYVNVTNVSLER